MALNMAVPYTIEQKPRAALRLLGWSRQLNSALDVSRRVHLSATTEAFAGSERPTPNPRRKEIR
jgi:hypothetical protein